MAAHRDHCWRDLSRRHGKSDSEFIREGILADPPLDRAAWERELAYIDSLIRRAPLKGGRAWKREDLYER